MRRIAGGQDWRATRCIDGRGSEKIVGGLAIWLNDKNVLTEKGDIKEGINVQASVWMEIRDGRK